MGHVPRLSRCYLRTISAPTVAQVTVGNGSRLSATGPEVISAQGIQAYFAESRTCDKKSAKLRYRLTGQGV